MEPSILTSLLDNDVQIFINENLGSEITSLALKKNPFPNIPYHLILEQIESKNKSKEKLPTWYKTKKIIFPPKISIEQTSSETAALYKASLINGDKIIDLSGGFGIDAFYFSNSFKKVVHCEINEYLSKIVSHNFCLLKKQNIDCNFGNSTEILKQINSTFDYIYVDPSRRTAKKGKVFLLTDCEPNVPELLSFYFQYSTKILIKTSPILDIKAGLEQLSNVKFIHIIAIDNEVKEILWEIEKNWQSSIKINAINIENKSISKTSTIVDENYIATYSNPENYLYEPNVSIMKSGSFSAISQNFKINKLHFHSHLYTSQNLVDFPGRRFSIDEIIPFQKNKIKEKISNSTLNVSTRNFPLKPDDLKRKYKIKDGGSKYAFFTTNFNNEKIIIICSKIPLSKK